MRQRRFSPLDVARKTFPKTFKGFDSDEVRLFLKAVSEDIESMVVENNKLIKDNARMEATLKDFHEKEKILRDTLYAAQKTSEDTKRLAEKEAELVLKQAEMKGDDIIRATQLRSHQVEKQIVDLKLERERVFLTLQDTLRRIQSMVDIMEETGDEGDLHVMVPKEKSS